MKKSVILILAIVYLMSAFIVGLIGVDNPFWKEVVYVNKISYVPQGKLNAEETEKSKGKYEWYDLDNNGREMIALNEAGKKQLSADVYILYKVDFEKGNLVLRLPFNVYPTNAANKKLSYAVSGANSNVVTYVVDDDGYLVLTFTGEHSLFKVDVKPQDGANITFTVAILVKAS